MWQGSSQRVRALQSEKRRQKERLARPIHIKRVRAEIKPRGSSVNQQLPITDGRVILNDISAQGMGLFSTQPQLVGQEVSITLEEPRRIFLRGRIIWCQEHDTETHVISQNAYSYRVGIKFLFESKEEEELIKQFVAELGRDVLYNKAA